MLTYGKILNNSDTCENIDMPELFQVAIQLIQEKDSVLQKNYSKILKSPKLINGVNSDSSKQNTSFFSINIRKKSIYEINEIFSYIRNMIEERNTCHLENISTTDKILCKWAPIQAAIEDAANYNIETSNSLLRTFKQLYTLHSLQIFPRKISTDAFTQMMGKIYSKESFRQYNFLHDLSQIYTQYYLHNSLIEEDADKKISEDFLRYIE